MVPSREFLLIFVFGITWMIFEAPLMYGLVNIFFGPVIGKLSYRDCPTVRGRLFNVLMVLIMFILASHIEKKYIQLKADIENDETSSHFVVRQFSTLFVLASWLVYIILTSRTMYLITSRILGILQINLITNKCPNGIAIMVHGTAFIVLGLMLTRFTRDYLQTVTEENST